MVLEGATELSSQMIAVGDRVRRAQGILRLDVKVIGVNDDVHPRWGP